MQLTYKGKTKDVYKLEDGNTLLVFKDDMTGKDGEFDPGANTVGLSIDGAGIAGLLMSVYYFELLNKKGYLTHYISSEENRMTVKPVTMFGGGLEVICRYKAMGSFIRRYGDYIKEGTPLDALVEMTLKNDKANDPLINKDALEALGILQHGEYEKIKLLMQNICNEIKNDLLKKGMELCDIKLEFSKDKQGNLMLIDEVSGGNMRVIKNGVVVSPLELSRLVVC
ncbi:MAG: phosphoribosylaminoimidazolesuccinocarboxamide synthase [Oscillospiraceae bacterium]|jgi:phosphoribosylaminoimidazole-succinocarboxamide synthase|nr:phosphoribosylaminoimidazolesuccinocarboxamide synthase [Oscillospiraceae bacterium]